MRGRGSTAAFRPAPRPWQASLWRMPASHRPARHSPWLLARPPRRPGSLPSLPLVLIAPRKSPPPSSKAPGRLPRPDTAPLPSSTAFLALPAHRRMPGGPGAAVPQRKRRRGLLLGVVALVAAVIAGGVTGAVLILSKGESPASMAQQAGQAIGRAAGVTLSGRYNLTPA